MKRLGLLSAALLAACGVLAQTGDHTTSPISDTIDLREVVIAEPLPLNNKQVELFYKTNSFTTIDNVVARLDGVTLIRRGSYAMEPTLNGFSGGQINVTIDGMKMFGACTDRMDPITSYIEPTNLKSISIQQGTNACNVGSNIGGAIDMSLQDPGTCNGHDFTVSAGAGYESISHGRTFLLNAGVARNKWKWGLNGVYRNNECYRDGYGNVVPYTQFEKTNIHSALRFEPDSFQSFKADLLYDLALDVGYTALPMDVSKARAYIISVEYKNTKRFPVTAKVYYNSILHIMDDSQRDSAFYVTNQITGQQELVYMRMDMPGESSTLGAFVQGGFKWNTRNRLTVKIDNYTNRSLAEMTMYMHYPGQPMEAPMYLQTWPDITRNVTGIYLQNSTNLSEKVIVRFGGRVDYNLDILRSDLVKQQFSVFNYDMADSYDQLTKSLDMSLQYKISRSVMMNGETGYSERIPTISEKYGFYLFNAYDGYDYIGNPELRPESSVFGRLGFQYTTSFLKINFSQSVNYVRNYILGITDTLIPPMNFYTNGTRVYSNLPGATLSNTNLQIQWNPFRGFSVFVLTKYTWGQLNSGEPLPLIPPLNNVVSLNYQWKNLNFQVENESAMAQNRINIDYGEIASPAYTVFNIKGGYHLALWKGLMADLSLAVTNVFNAKYYAHLDWGQVYRPGRSVDVFLKVSF